MKTYVNGIYCPKCGDNYYKTEDIAKGFYRCCHHLYDIELFGKKREVVCSHCQIYCKTCNEVYDESDYWKDNNVWKCKTCNMPNWGYTEYMLEKEGVVAAAERINNTK